MLCCGWLRSGTLPVTPSCPVPFLKSVPGSPQTTPPALQLHPRPPNWVSPALEVLVPLVSPSPCSPPCPPPVPTQPGRAAPSGWLVGPGAAGLEPGRAIPQGPTWLEIPSCHPLVLEAAQKTPLLGAGCFSPSVPRLYLTVPTLFHRTGRAHCMSQLLLEAFPLTLRSVFGVIIPISCDFSPFSPVLFLPGCPLAAQLLLISSILLPPLQGRLRRRLNGALLANCPRPVSSLPPSDGPPCLINYLPLAVQ